MQHDTFKTMQHCIKQEKGLRKKPLQQQSNSPAWVHHAPLPRPLLLLHRPSHTQGDMIDTF